MDVFTTLPSHFMADAQSINLIYAGVIALFFGIANAGLAGLFVVPAIAAIVYIAAQAVIPPLVNHAPIVVPAIDKVLLGHGLVLYAVFFVAILVVFGVKRGIQAVIG
jgi:hypothetical protein